MRKAAKWIAIGLGSIILVAGLVFAYVAATFDPDDYKPRLIEAVQQKTGRTLQLPGKIELSFYPSIGAKLGAASLSEPKSNRLFASLSSAFVSVKVLPLLSREVIVDEVEIKGLRLNIERSKSGRMNFDDLTGAEKEREQKPSTPIKLDIARIEISDADVTFSDQAAGNRYRLEKLNLRTGRITDGVTTPLDLSADVMSEKDKAQLATKLKTKLTFELERKLYKLENLDFSVKGRYADVSGMSVTAKGDVEARLTTGEYAAKGLTLTMVGKRAASDLSVKLDAPKLTLTRDKVDGGKLVLEAALNEPGSKLVTRVVIASVQGAFTAFKAGPLDADIEMQGEGRSVKAKLNGTLSGNLETKRLELPQLALTAKVNDPTLPQGTLQAAINGALRADLEKQTANLELRGKLDESNVNGRLGVTKFSPLALTFDLDADQLDADRLLGKTPSAKSVESKEAGKQRPAPKEDKIDLSALKGIDAAGSLRIGKLTLFNLKSAQVRAGVKVAGGRLEISPMSAQLYQGSLNGALAAQAAHDSEFKVRQTLTGVAIGPLLRDAAQIDTLEGKGTVNADLTTRGATLAALKKALNGNAAVSLADGSIKGMDVAGTIRTARATIQQLRGQPVQSSSKTEKTDFSELKATFIVKNGVARNEDLSIKSPLLRVGGAGDIDIGANRMNYVLKATVVGTSKGQGGRDAAELSGVTVPVRLTGELEAPQWSIDFAGMVTDVAKQRLKDEIIKRTMPDGQAGSAGNVRDAIKDGLKGILGR